METLMWKEGYGVHLGLTHNKTSHVLHQRVDWFVIMSWVWKWKLNFLHITHPSVKGSLYTRSPLTSSPRELGREPCMRCPLPHHLTNACFMEGRWKRVLVRNFVAVGSCLSKLQGAVQPSHRGGQAQQHSAGQKGLSRVGQAALCSSAWLLHLHQPSPPPLQTPDTSCKPQMRKMPSQLEFPRKAWAAGCMHIFSLLVTWKLCIFANNFPRLLILKLAFFFYPLHSYHTEILICFF